jgi:TatD DNase family protein
LDLPEFDADRDRVIAAAREVGVARIVVPGIHAAGWPGLIGLCRPEDALYPALGLHPVYIDRHRDRHLRDLEGRLADHRLVAVGEIGLDFYLKDLDRDRQLRLFAAQLSIAASAGLPVLIHARKSHDEVLAALHRKRVIGGIIHAFSGSLQQAFKYVELGFKLGFGGMLTFERSRRLRSLAAELPLNSIVLETDAPDMAVAAHRGERNSPSYLPDVLRSLAEVRDQDPVEIAQITTDNAKACLSLHGNDKP